MHVSIGDFKSTVTDWLCLLLGLSLLNSVYSSNQLLESSCIRCNSPLNAISRPETPSLRSTHHLAKNSHNFEMALPRPLMSQRTLFLLGRWQFGSSKQFGRKLSWARLFEPEEAGSRLHGVVRQLLAVIERSWWRVESGVRHNFGGLVGWILEVSQFLSCSLGWISIDSAYPVSPYD